MSVRVQQDVGRVRGGVAGAGGDRAVSLIRSRLGSGPARSWRSSPACPRRWEGCICRGITRHPSGIADEQAASAAVLPRTRLAIASATRGTPAGTESAIAFLTAITSSGRAQRLSVGAGLVAVRAPGSGQRTYPPALDTGQPVILFSSRGQFPEPAARPTGLRLICKPEARGLPYTGKPPSARLHPDPGVPASSRTQRVTQTPGISHHRPPLRLGLLPCAWPGRGRAL